jgi:serpin B
MISLPFSSLALMIALSLSVACAAAAPPAAQPAKEEAKAAAAANNLFAAEVYAKLRTEAKGNLFFSPYSISTALAMVHAGAAGKTQAEIASVLHLKGNLPQVNAGYDALTGYLNAGGKAGGYQLAVANALWGQKNVGFLASYTDTLQKSYSANLFDVDFSADSEAARQRINKWVEGQTKEKIKDLMPSGSINNMTRLVLTNAIYFKGAWQDEFNKKSTRDMPFTLGDGKETTTPMMYQSKRFRYLAEEGFQAIALPYKDSQLSMVILLPKAKDGLAALENKLTGEGLAEVLKKISAAGMTKVNTSIPRFKTASTFGLNKTLADLGMPTVFTEAADLSGINGRRDLSIQAAVHKAFVDVNEEGTEAAAATGISIGVTSVQADPTVFRADHPFLFMIHDNATGAVLFMGRLMDPKDEGK